MSESDEHRDEVSDETIVVASDHTVAVTRDHTEALGSDETVAVAPDETVAVAADETVFVGADRTLVVPTGENTVVTAGGARPGDPLAEQAAATERGVRADVPVIYPTRSGVERPENYYLARQLEEKLGSVPADAPVQVLDRGGLESRAKANRRASAWIVTGQIVAVLAAAGGVWLAVNLI